tara:strand:+ start:8471 stop:8728 length:258 start_codon:yes stop_codon:yes gene_type:complete
MLFIYVYTYIGANKMNNDIKVEITSAYNKIIKVEITSAYGQKRIIPLTQNGKILAKIAGTKTLTSETIELAKLLGYSFTVVTREI